MKQLCFCLDDRDPYPALQQADHKVSVYLSPNYSLKAACTGQKMAKSDHI